MTTFSHSLAVIHLTVYQKTLFTDGGGGMLYDNSSVDTIRAKMNFHMYV